MKDFQNASGTDFEGLLHDSVRLPPARSQLAQRAFLGWPRRTHLSRVVSEAHPTWGRGRILAVTAWTKCTAGALSTQDPLLPQTFPWKSDGKFAKSSYKPVCPQTVLTSCVVRSAM